MGEREWWANVYADDDGCHAGSDHPTPKLAEKYAALVRRSPHAADPLFRIHVRLKPEGAPKRYADETERQRWESFSALLKQQAVLRQRMEADIGAAHGHLWLTDPVLDGRRPPEMIARVEADIRARFPSA